MDGSALMKHQLRRALFWSVVALPFGGTLLFAGGYRGRVEVGSISGSVRFTGAAPNAEIVDLSTDAYCLAAHPGEVVVTRPILTDAAGGLSDVIVYVKEGAPVGELPLPSEPAVLDQEGCEYSPRVVALRVGQTMVIRNSDATLHNVHVSAQENRSFNIGQPLRGIESRRTFQNPEVGIGVKCDIHGWMTAVIGVFDHPFFAITSVDGSFTLDDLPPGEYVVEAWHKTLGSQVQTITVAEGAVEASFVF